MTMRRGVIYSAILHAAVALLLIFGLPQFFEDRVLDQQTMVVEMVQIAEKSNPPPSPAPRVEPPKPTPPKPVVEDKPPPPPQAKPETPQPPPIPEPPKPQVAEKPPEPAPKPPEAKPEPKPEVKKPDPPPPPKETATPPPPKQVAKIVPPKKPPPKPRRDDFIDSILKDVAPTQRTQEKTDAKPQKDTAPRPSPAPPSLDQQVTMSEIDAVRRQISQCWNIPAGARDAKDLIVTIRATVAPDGRVTSARIEDLSRMGDPFYRAAAESAQRAMLNPNCQPLKLPPQKYEQWKDLRIDFNPKDMIG